MQKSASASSDTSLLESKRRALERKLEAKQRGVSASCSHAFALVRITPGMCSMATQLRLIGWLMRYMLCLPTASVQAALLAHASTL